MKKIIILVAISLFSASSAFAAGSISLALTTTGLSLWGAKSSAASGTGMIGKTSTGVGIGIITNASGYGLATQHKNGTKAFGTTYDSTAIYTTAVTTKGTPVSVTLTTASSCFSGWTTM